MGVLCTWFPRGVTLVLMGLVSLSAPGLAAPPEAPPEAPKERDVLEDELFGAPPKSPGEGQSPRGERSGEAAGSREDELFGEGATTRDDELFGDGPARESDIFGESAASREENLFGGEGPAEGSIVDRFASALSEVDNWTQFGGQLFLRLNWTTSPFKYTQVTTPAATPGGLPELSLGEDQNLSAPNLADIYLDARPTPRLRGYVRARFRYDYTVRADTRVFGQVPASESINLDQLWLKFDVLQFAYLTVGQQPIRWGSSRFWNPTDVMNNQIRDPLAVFDERLGVNLVKVHIPVESLGWNFYLVANMDGAADFQDVGGAARAEFLIEQTEIALTAAYRDQRPLTLGFDISSALWLFDVRAEVAVLYDMQAPFWAGQFVIDPATFAFETPRSRSRADDWILQGVVGADISIPYNDENDALILGGEYFYNDAGYKTSNLYTWLALQGQFNPLYVGRHYVAAYATMFAPGHWDDTSFILSWLANLSDGSHVIRFDAAVTFFTRLTFNVFTNVYLGNEMGSFRNGRAPQFDTIDVNTVSPELLAGFGQSRETLLGFQRGQPAALFDAGVGLRIQY